MLYLRIMVTVIALLMTTNLSAGNQLEKKTWKQIESALENGVDTALITIGATEQHGPHLALPVIQLPAIVSPARLLILRETP